MSPYSVGMEPADTRTDELEVGRRRWWRYAWIPALLLLVGVAWWWAFHPAALPTSAERVEATVKAGQTVYIGVPVGSEKERRLTIHSTSVSAEGAEVSAWVCTGGSIATTTRPEPFCEKWQRAEDADLRLAGGDQLVLGVQSDAPGTVEVGRVHVDFSEGLQRGRSDLGATYVVEFLG